MIQKILKYTLIPGLTVFFYQVMQIFFLSLPSYGPFAFQDDTVFRTCIVDMVMIAVCLSLLHTVLSDKKLGITKPKHFRFFPWFVLMAVALLLGQCAATAIYTAYGDSFYDSYLLTMSETTKQFYLLLSVLIAPMFEELYCRGIIYRSIRKIMPVFPAAVLSSLIFALMHGTLLHLIPTFLLAMVSAIAFEATGRIWVSILLHSLNNIIVLWIGGATLPDFFFQPLFLFLCIGGFIGLLTVLCFCIKRPLSETVVVDEPCDNACGQFIITECEFNKDEENEGYTE